MGTILTAPNDCKKEHMNNSIEQELKIALTKAEYDELLDSCGVEPQLQTNYYFYCDEMPSDTMVRLRKRKGKYQLCYKRLLSSHMGVNVCDEREQALDEQTALSFIESGISAEELTKRLDVEGDLSYRCVGSLDTYRARFAEKNWLLELDKNEYLGVTDYELECECGSEELLCRLKDYLRYNYGIDFKSSKAKSARFFEEYFKK